MNEDKKYSKTLEFPKPKKNGKGSTVQVKYSKDLKCVFLEMANQKSDTTVVNARFDYNDKLVVKLNSSDLGAILLVLSGKKPNINNDKGLYHEFEKEGRKTITTTNFKKNDPKYGGYYLTISKSLGSERKNAGVLITEPESIVLGIVLRSHVEKIYE